MAKILNFQYSCFFVVLISSCQILIEAKNAGFSVQLLRRNSSNSHLKHAFQRTFSQNGGATTRVTSNNGDYLMKLTLGTPPFDIYGLVDTGSDLVWAQCKPCNGCYKQKNPFFDPQNSKTYKNIQCKTGQCNLLPPVHSCSAQNLCSYTYGYGDGSATNGVLASETVTFSSSKGAAVVVNNILFGCGHKNTGNFNENEMGLIGLGGGPLSLVSQLGTIYGSKRFSQCLVPFHTDPHISGTVSNVVVH